MKKTTLTMALAAMTVLSVSAQYSSQKLTDFSEVQVMSQPVSVAKVSKMQKAPAKISSASEIYGLYEWPTFDYASKKDHLASVDIAAGVGQDEVVLTLPTAGGFVNGKVDVANSTLRIMTTDTGQFNSNYGENVMFGPVTCDNDGYFVAADYLDLTINSDGSIEFPIVNNQPTGIGVYVSSGFFVVFATSKEDDPGVMTPVRMTEINLDEWKPAGTAQFTEPILNTLLKANYDVVAPAYTVEMMVNKANPSKYLVVNPYKTNVFDEYGLQSLTPDATGYMVVDATDPKCVLVDLLVATDYGYPRGEETIEPMCVFNMEAMMVRSGYTTEDVYFEYGGNDEYSSYMEGNKIVLAHMRFNFPSAPLSIYYWVTTEGEEVKMLEGILELDPASVDGVEVDNSNAPVKYYNLQGVEIANPAKGELVIKRQGTSSKKMVVK